MNSVVSDRMDVPPSATIRSLISPIRGLAARPLVGSLPPHSVPTMSSLMGNASFCSIEASAAISFAARTASSTVLMVPPHSWMMNCARGLFVRSRIASTAPGFGFQLKICIWLRLSGSS